MWLIVLYLAAIVLANLTTAAFGPAWSVINAFLFIGLDLTTRDALHDKWQGEQLWKNMAALIIFGSLLSAVLNWNASQIAIASGVSFFAAAFIDTFVYQRLHHKPKWIKINGSNVFSATADSIIFPAIAFGFPLLWPIMIGQFVAKVGGGFIWSIIINKFSK